MNVEVADANLRDEWVAHRHATYVIDPKVDSYPVYDAIADCSTSALTAAISERD